MLLRPLHHLRRNVIAYLALFLALGAGGSYALAATATSGTIAVCVDKGSGVMHIAKHPRCGRGQSRIGLSSALDRPTVSAWATANVNGGIESGAGAAITHAGAGTYEVRVTAANCRHAFNNAPVVSVNDGEPPVRDWRPRLPFLWRGPRRRAAVSKRSRSTPASVVAGAFRVTRRTVQLHRLVRVGRGEEERMRMPEVRRSARWATDSRSSSCLRGPLFASPIAHAASDPLKPIVITPSSGCGLLTSYTAGNSLAGLVGASILLRVGRVHSGVQPGEHSSAAALFAALGRRVAPSWRGSPAACPREQGWGYQITAPPGITIRNVDYDASDLQNIADGRGWIGFTYWNGGTGPVHPDGTAVDAAASGH